WPADHEVDRERPAEPLRTCKNALVQTSDIPFRIRGQPERKIWSRTQACAQVNPLTAGALLLMLLATWNLPFPASAGDLLLGDHRTTAVGLHMPPCRVPALDE